MKRIGYIALALGICGIFLIHTQALSGTPKDGEYYFEKMRESMIEILSENQKLINTKPDGSVKNQKLLPNNIYTESYEQFKKIGIGQSFRLKDLAGETNPEKIAPVLATLLQAGRDVMSTLQDDINGEPDGSVKPKKFVPAIFGRLTIERFTSKTGMYMKQTTLGRGTHTARNPSTAPDEWEVKALKEFANPGWELNRGFGQTVGNQYRYAKPLYIKKGCLACHGDAEGDTAPYGHVKQGYKLNDVRGGISVTLPR